MNDTTQEGFFGINKKVLVFFISVMIVAGILGIFTLYRLVIQKNDAAKMNVPTVTTVTPVPSSGFFHTFEKYGFSLDIPKSLFTGVTCYPDFMRTPSTAKSGGTYGSFCNNSITDKPYIRVGWKEKNLDNTTFSLKVASDLVYMYFGPNKKFTSVCDNHTGIAVTVDAGFSSRAFSCAITVDGKNTFTAVYYIFYIGKQPDVTNWITVSDPSLRGSATSENMIELAKGIKIVNDTKQSSFLNTLIETAYAGVDDNAGGGGAGGGSDGGGGSSGPDLSDGSGGNVSDGSGNNVGTGGGSSDANGGGGNGNGGGIPVVNGVCTPTHNNCTSGTLGNVYENSSVFEWWCMGSGGGTDILCSESKPLPTGSLTISPLSCQIAVGASTCPVSATWSTANPRGTSAVTTNIPSANTVLYNADAGGPSSVSVKGPSTQSYYLYNNGSLLDSKTVTVSCVAGSWDSTNAVCANPQVVSAVVKNLYYPPGKIDLVCSDSDSYSVLKGGSPFVPVSPYNGPKSIAVTAEDNYTLKCIHGSVEDQVVRFYDATPDPAVVSLQVSPITIGKDGKIVASWKTKFPTNACSLTAKVVCANNACTAAQNAFQTSLNTALQTERTDQNDPATSRLVTTAVKTVAPGHLDVDWVALGKKTLQITYTTDLIYDCGGGNKETKRIQVTKSDIQ